MAGEEWPIAAPAADRAVDPARGAGRSRLATVRADFFLDPETRLSEQERALMSALLNGLVNQIVDDIIAELPGGAGPANDEGCSDLTAELRRAGLLDLPELIALLLQRADEERIASALRALGDTRQQRHLQSLVAGDSGDVSAAAMALILARGRRRDRLGQALIELDDVPSHAAGRLVHAIAAALARRLPRLADGIARVAEAVIGRHEPAKGTPALAARLVAVMEKEGRCDDARLAAAAEEGDVVVLAEALARRAGISETEATDHLLDGGGGRLVLLLRMAGASRELAARVLAALGELVGIGDPGQEIACFDALDDDAAGAARRRLSWPEDYRSALAALEADHGQRSV